MRKMLVVIAFIIASPVLSQSSAQVSDAPSAAADTKNAAGGKIAFDVASIKPNDSGIYSWGVQLPRGRFVAKNMTPKLLVEWAYGSGAVNDLRDDRIAGGPTWINTEHYDIDAKIEDQLLQEQKEVTSDQWRNEVRLMVRSLLEDRFHLKTSYTAKVVPVFALVVAKGGPKLAVSSTPPNPGDSANARPPAGSIPPKMPGLQIGKDRLIGNAIGIGDLAYFLSKGPEFGGREIQDRTGLTGLYDFDLKWTPTSAAPNDAGSAASSLAPDAAGPSVFTAVEEQLGLKLITAKASVQILVIDHIEEPSPN